MAQQNKIRLMSRLAVLEKNQGRELERFQRSFHSDYIGIPMLKNAIRITAVYLLLVLIWCSGRVEWLLDITAKGQIGLLLTGVLAAFLMLMLITLILTFLAYSARYYRIRRTAEEYQELLEELHQLERDTSTGGEE